MTKLAVSVGILCLLVVPYMVNGQAVMSIDLGSEYLKVAIVKPGVPMEVVLNKESKRKTPTVVAMRDDERHFSDPALATGVKFPKKAFRFVRDLLGKPYEHEVVERYKKWFPYYTLVKDETTGMPVFHVDDKTRYTPEELMAMIIENAKHCAEVFAESKMNDVVITVPAYFNQAERRALVRATRLAKLNLLQLMGDNAAVALNYGIFRRKEFSNLTQYIMFYDMGSSSTTATIVAYQMVKTNVAGMMESNPQLVIKGVGVDPTLGGLEMTLRLRDHLAAEFTRIKKTSSDVYANDRAMAKLWKEAERLKQILSANSEYMSQVEGLLDEEDFRVRVTRDQFETMCADLFDRLMKPVADALKFSQITPSEIKEVVLMGAGTRMPRVQSTLQAYLKREELSKNINTDEAAVLGAVYQAAHLTVGFKVKKFIVKEAVMYPVLVEFDKHVTGSKDHAAKMIKRTLFGHMNPYPQKKVMTFNKHTADFSFNISYGELGHLGDGHRKGFGNGMLATVGLSGVATAYDKNIADAESKGVKAHFRMDDSGLLHLDTVESVFEKAAAEVNDSAASAWTKIGDALGGLFGSGNADVEDKLNATTNDTKSEPVKAEPTKQPEEDTPEQKTKEEKPAEDKKEEKKEETKEGSTPKSNATQDQNDTAPVKEKPKPVIVKENIEMTAKILDMVDPTEDNLASSIRKLDELHSRDLEKMALERARNDLEAFIYALQHKLTQEAYIKCSQEAEREKLGVMTREADDWQYEQSEDSTKEVFIDKLKAMKKQSEALELRVQEYLERPKTVDDLRGMIVHGRNFSETVHNLTKADPDIVTAVEMATLEKLLNNTEIWLNKSIAEQEKSPLYEAPVFTKSSVIEKGGEIAREIQYLVTKIMSYKRKTPKPVEKNDTAANTTTKRRPKKSATDKDAPPKNENIDASTKKTLEDLEAIPGIRVIKPEEFFKYTEKTDGESGKKGAATGVETEDKTSDKDEHTTKTDDSPQLELPPADDKTDETVKSTKDDSTGDKTDQTTTPRSDL